MKKIIFFLACFSALLCLTACSNKAEVEEKATSLVDKEIQSIFSRITPQKLYKCVKVELNSEIENDGWTEYSGVAYLENGTTVRCEVFYCEENESVLVVINPYSFFK